MTIDSEPTAPTATPTSPAADGGRIAAASLARTRGLDGMTLAAVGVLLVAAFAYVWNLTVSGYANDYYSAAAWAGAQRWSAWFFGSIDPSNFITIDKPPLATMVLGLSVRLFGLSSASVLLPQALMGIGSVAILMATVRRTAGGTAAVIAGLVMALTPAAVLMFRYNNPDALLTLLLVASAYTFVRGLEDGRHRWLAATGILVGLAFETKLLQGWMVLPAYALVWGLLAPGSARRRVAGLGIALVAVLAASAWWLLGMQLTPAELRPYVGGSTDGSALDLVLGYNGLGRLFGGSGNMTGGGPGGAFAGTPGLLRFFNDEMAGQTTWFLPFAVVGLVAAILGRRGTPRTDVPRAALVMWGLWLAIHVGVFSFMSGTIHSYYAVVIAPALGALVGPGLVTLWRARSAGRSSAGLAFGATVAGSAALAALILGRTPDFLPGLGGLVLAVGVVAGALLALPFRLAPRRVAAAATVVALAALFAGPVTYALDTMSAPHAGGVVSAGPAWFGRGGGQVDGPGGAGPGGAPPDGRVPPDGSIPPGGLGPGFPGSPDGSSGSSSIPGFWLQGGGAAPLGTSSIDLDYLVANRGDADWIVAVRPANSAAAIQLVALEPVMALGGFTGSDPAPTLAQFQSYVAAGRLRFVIVETRALSGGMGPPGAGAGADTAIESWVTATCSTVGEYDALYDCRGATD